MNTGQKKDTLKRSISLTFLVFYGLGTMIGGGIYALTGKVAGIAGIYAPISFTLSALLALITALSYAELSARFPLSAGEVRYINAAFSRKKFAALLGWLIVFTGIVSSAALANATAGFIQDFVMLPSLPLTIAIVLVLGFVAIWGITESVLLVTIITLIEIGGLILIIYAGRDELMMAGSRLDQFVLSNELYDMAVWGSIFSGAFLAFYAFIGFEDMVNVAEEVKDVRRAMPAAIIIAVMITLIVYFLVSLVSVSLVSPEILANSNTPLATIIDHSDIAAPLWLMGLISILATVNGVLVQMIMGSRVLYGMANGGEAPIWFKKIHDKTLTPIRATAFVIIFVLLFASLSDLETLAKAASTIILFVFVCVNAALIKLKCSAKAKDDDLFTTPLALPITGLIVCSAMLIWQFYRLFF